MFLLRKGWECPDPPTLAGRRGALSHGMGAPYRLGLVKVPAPSQPSRTPSGGRGNCHRPPHWGPAGGAWGWGAGFPMMRGWSRAVSQGPLSCRTALPLALQPKRAGFSRDLCFVCSPSVFAGSQQPARPVWDVWQHACQRQGPHRHALPPIPHLRWPCLLLPALRSSPAPELVGREPGSTPPRPRDGGRKGCFNVSPLKGRPEQRGRFYVSMFVVIATLAVAFFLQSVCQN